MDSEARFGFYGSNYIGEGAFRLYTYIEKHLFTFFSGLYCSVVLLEEVLEGVQGQIWIPRVKLHGIGHFPGLPSLLEPKGHHFYSGVDFIIVQRYLHQCQSQCPHVAFLFVNVQNWGRFTCKRTHFACVLPLLHNNLPHKVLPLLHMVLPHIPIYPTFESIPQVLLGPQTPPGLLYEARPPLKRPLGPSFASKTFP